MKEEETDLDDSSCTENWRHITEVVPNTQCGDKKKSLFLDVAFDLDGSTRYMTCGSASRLGFQRHISLTTSIWPVAMSSSILVVAQARDGSAQ